MTAINSVTAVVPMRHSSERVPNKNFRIFRGLPLYAHIIRTLLTSSRVETVVIDTDSSTITDDCRKRFPEVRLLPRPGHLTNGAIPMNAVLEHTLTQLDGDWFLQTHSTNPLLTAATIDSAIADLESHLDRHDSLFGVTRWQTRLYHADGTPINHEPAKLERTQDLPPVYEENSNLYLFSRGSFDTTRQRIGKRPRLFEIDRLEATDIDDDTGWRLAEAIAASRHEEAAK